MYRIIKLCIALIVFYCSIVINAKDEIDSIPYPPPLGVEVKLPDKSFPKELKSTINMESRRGSSTRTRQNQNKKVSHLFLTLKYSPQLFVFLYLCFFCSFIEIVQVLTSM